MSDHEGDDLDTPVDEDHEDDGYQGEHAIVDGLAGVLQACAALRDERLALGLTVADVAARCACDGRAIEWLDEGDVGAPLEALVYYASAVGLAVDVVVRRTSANG